LISFLPNNNADRPDPSFCLDLTKRSFSEAGFSSTGDLSFLKKLNKAYGYND
jgi:hypothetical protein